MAHKLFIFLVGIYLSMCPQPLLAKVRILTFHYNRPEFLEYQSKLLHKFLWDDFEIIVFNDAPSSHDQLAIEAVCANYGLTCVRYEQSWHDTDPLNTWIRDSVDTPEKNSFFRFPLIDGCPDISSVANQCSIRHCHVIQHALERYGYDHDDIVVILDADVFPLKPFSIREWLSHADIIGIDSEFQHLHYLWVPFIAFNPQSLPSPKELKFHVGFIEELLCDTGSASYEYLKNHPEVTFQLFPRIPDKALFPWDAGTFSNLGLPDLSLIRWPVFMEFYVDYHFLHFCGGAGIHPQKKFEDIREILNTFL